MPQNNPDCRRLWSYGDINDILNLGSGGLVCGQESLGCTPPCLPSLDPAAPFVALAKVLKMFTQKSRDCTWSGIAKVVLKLRSGEFPGDPVVKTQHFRG